MRCVDTLFCFTFGDSNQRLVAVGILRHRYGNRALWLNPFLPLLPPKASSRYSLPPSTENPGLHWVHHLCCSHSAYTIWNRLLSITSINRSYRYWNTRQWLRFAHYLYAVGDFRTIGAASCAHQAVYERQRYSSDGSIHRWLRGYYVLCKYHSVSLPFVIKLTRI
jgi:hypothetical protein